MNKWILLSVGFLSMYLFASSLHAADTGKRKIFGAWQHVCDDSTGCQSILSLADNKTGERMLSWSFVYDVQKGKLSTVVTLPLGIALPVGLKVKLSDGTEYGWAFQVCDKQGCRAVANVDASMETALAGASSAELKFVPYGSRTAVSLPVPMDGFRNATRELKSSVTRQ